MNWYEKSAGRALAAYAANIDKRTELEAEELARERRTRDHLAAELAAFRLKKIPTEHREAGGELLARKLAPRPIQAAAFATWRRLRRPSILLTGKTELGKSTALAALCIREINDGRDARYVTAPRLGGILVGKDELHTWAELEACDFLVIDELHRLPALSARVATAAAGLLDHRYGWKKPTGSAATCGLELLAGLIRWELCRRFTVRIPDDYTPKGLDK